MLQDKSVKIKRPILEPASFNPDYYQLLIKELNILKQRH